MSSNEIQGLTGDILLDAGTNELEVLVFRMDGGVFGVNVAKVREVIRPVETISAPHQHESVVGMFSIRGQVLPLVDLPKHLDLREDTQAELEDETRVIIMEFNGQRTGFIVDAVDQIHRISWERVKPSPDLNVCGPADDSREISATTGTIEMGEDLVLMIDFESVADSILHEDRLHIEAVPNDLDVDRNAKRLVLAEDSPFMRRLVTQTLKDSGYTNIAVFPDGRSAWDHISSQEPGTIDAIVSDIEMPRMDGLALAKHVKDSQHSEVPTMLFSSLVSQDNIKKGKQVGVEVQVPKPELLELVSLIDRLVEGLPIDANMMSADVAQEAA